MQAIMEKVLANPAMALMALPEVMGALILAWFAWQLVRTGHVRSFLRQGQV
jgi:hypothetical protein